MSNPAPVLRVRGTIHGAPEARTVPAVPASPAEYADNGNLIRTAREAKPGYRVHDLVVLTDHGGFATFVMREEAVEEARQADASFTVPEEGDRVDLPCYAFDQWKGERRRYAVKAYSFAGKAYAAEHKSSKSGSRVAAVS